MIIQCNNVEELYDVLAKIECETDCKWGDGTEPTDIDRNNPWMSSPYPKWLILKDGIIHITNDIEYAFVGDFESTTAKEYLKLKLFLDDPVNHPAHYTSGKVECIDAMEALYGVEAVKAFCVCNMFKYLWRRKDKDNEEQDIHKALWYFDRYVELVNR